MASATHDLVSLDRKEIESSSRENVSELAPSLGKAAARVLDLTQRVAIDRIELLQMESYNRLIAAARNASLLLIAGDVSDAGVASIACGVGCRPERALASRSEADLRGWNPSSFRVRAARMDATTAS